MALIEKMQKKDSTTRGACVYRIPQSIDDAEKLVARTGFEHVPLYRVKKGFYGRFSILPQFYPTKTAFFSENTPLFLPHLGDSSL
jgi:hypothetical protein